MRCLTLASALRDRGAICHFICRAHDGNLIWRIEQDGFKVHTLQKGTGCKSQKETSKSKLQHEKWLGAHWQEDAELVQTILQKLKTDWLIIDHYALDQRWESMQRMVVNKIMVIDDLADRIHDCDILLDQNLVRNFRSRYEKKVSDDCVKLLGPNYILLSEAFRNKKRLSLISDREIRRVLIYFGGVDSLNITGLVLDACFALGRDKINYEVVINKMSPHSACLKKQISKFNNVVLHQELPNLADIMSCSDLCIGAGGTTTWERCYMGLPTIVIALADNQIKISEELDRVGVVSYLGHFQKIAQNDICHRINKMLRPEVRVGMAKKGADLVDASGVFRVCDALWL